MLAAPPDRSRPGVVDEGDPGASWKRPTGTVAAVKDEIRVSRKVSRVSVSNAILREAREIQPGQHEVIDDGSTEGAQFLEQAPEQVDGIGPLWKPGTIERWADRE